MPLTNKEKMARRQAKINADPNRREQYLEAERERKKKQREIMKNSMSARQLRQFKAKESARILAIHKKKRAEKVKCSEGKNTSGNSVHEEDNSVVPYKSNCTLQKAVYKACRNLPASPRKKKAVVASLAKNCGLQLSPQSISKKTDSKLCLNEKTYSLVDEFYNNDEISWQAPGRKDRLLIREKDENGRIQKSHIQLRYMLMSLSEAYEQFQSFCNEKIGFSKFASLRPKHVKIFDKIPHNVCVCVYHENVRLLLQALKPSTQLNQEFSGFINQVVCSPTLKDCMYSECETCANKLLSLKPQEDVQDTPAKYFQWQKSEKVEIISTVKETFSELIKQSKYFLRHTYIKRQQSLAFENFKAAVNGEDIVIQLDFSENAAILQQNEIQASHWNHTQATIFTAHAWISKEVSQSVVIISDSLDHTKVAVFKFVNYLLRYLKKEHSSIKSVQVFSDGPSSQFKQRYLFSNLFLFEQHHNIKLTWNFFATSHGKGVVDGIGGTVKRAVWRHMKTGKKTVVNTPKEYADIASKLMTKIHIKYISSEEMEEDTEYLNTYWEKILPIPNIQTIHCVTATEHNKIITSVTSLLQSRSVVTLFDDESSEDEDPFEDNQKNIDIGSLKENDWILVKYDSMLYPGYITQIIEKEIEVTVMHKSNKHYKWPENEDKIFYSLQCVVKKISSPTPVGNRGQFIFNEKM